MENIFCEYELKTWNDVRSLVKKLDGWIFRGQGNKEWDLNTTLERGARNSSYDIRAMVEIENKIFREFQRKAPNYKENLPKKDKYLEWFSLMQHYEAPTRLLDFTYSFYIASFFSTENTTVDSAIFCLNKDLILSKGKERAEYLKMNSEFEFGTVQYCDNLIGKDFSSSLVILTEPFYMNERLALQQGLFAVPFDVIQGFEYNLSLTTCKNRKTLPEKKNITSIHKNIDLLNSECVLLKIVLPKKLHKDIKEDLRKMNINSATLFPGIDGFARSLYSEFDTQIESDLIKNQQIIIDEMKARK